MATERMYNFRAPSDLKEALRRVTYEKKFKSESHLMRSIIMRYPAIAEVLKTLKKKTN